MSDQEQSTPGASAPEPASAEHEANPEAIEASPEATAAPEAGQEATSPAASVEEEPEEQDTVVVY
ncbi:MAG: hypothetical protein QOF28_787, partial [Actinomycetota bacterium]|nr:hypothetical protein [Actinomycetota bacterium]